VGHTGQPSAQAVNHVEHHWQGSAEGCCWTWSYDDGIAVYHSLTGSTHILPATVWQVLAAMVQGCGTVSGLQQHLLMRGHNLAHEEVQAALEALQMARLASPVY
jgi:PqqD family protein of HPr-rel-A system